MAKVRLNAEMRALLLEYAKGLEPDRTEMLQATIMMQKELAASWNTQWPQDDMEVLAKYDVATIPCRIDISSPDNSLQYRLSLYWQDVHWQGPPLLCAGKYVPSLIVDREDSFTWDCIVTAYDAQKQYEKDNQQLQQAFTSLINSTRNAEDLVHLWPEAESILKPYMKPAIVKNMDLAEKVKKMQPVKKQQIGNNRC